MATLNKVMLIGRLTADPESRTFSNGGKVTSFRFAVSNRKKNAQSGQWEEEPMFIDCKAFNRGEFGTLANTIEQYCRKGSQIFIEGKLNLEQWDDKTSGQKRSKHVIVVEVMQFLDGKPQEGQSGGGGGGPRMAGGAPANSRPAAAQNDGQYDEPQQSDGGGDIPF